MRVPPVNELYQLITPVAEEALTVTDPVPHKEAPTPVGVAGKSNIVARTAVRGLSQVFP